MNKLGFKSETVQLSVAELHPMFPRKISFKQSKSYRKILSSIREIGIIEPLVVIDRGGRYFIKDGVLRWYALKELEIEKVECLIGTDSDVYTYNKRVNQLTPIQAHDMIDKAIKNGVDPDKIASTLNVSRHWVNQMGTLIEGLDRSIVKKLERRVMTKSLILELKKVHHDRQKEILLQAERADNYSLKYIKALIIATPADQRKAPLIGSKYVNVKEQEELGRQLRMMEQEFRKASETFRDNTFMLVKLSGYIRQLLANDNVREFLGENYPDILVEFEKISNDKSLDL